MTKAPTPKIIQKATWQHKKKPTKNFDYKTTADKTFSPFDDQLVILSKSKALDYFRTGRGEILRVFDLP